MAIKVTFNGIPIGFCASDVVITAGDRTYRIKNHLLKDQFQNPLLLLIDRWFSK